LDSIFLSPTSPTNLKKRIESFLKPYGQLAVIINCRRSWGSIGKFFKGVGFRMNEGGIRMSREGSTIYGWAFAAGREIIRKLEDLYGRDRVEKKMESMLLTLRSELIPERFRRAIIDFLIEVGPHVGIPEEVKVERRWSVDEFYRYSTAILAGFFDALNSWRGGKGAGKEGEGGEVGGR
jgi:hypothetical protein